MLATMGAQNPEQRITQPAESLRRLEEAVPTLTALRRTRPAVIDWARAESALGTPLPGDYKLLAEAYPSFASSGGYLRVGLPAPGDGQPLPDTEELLDIVRDWWEEDMSMGLPPHPAPGGLLPWADSEQGDLFLWSTTGDAPDDWPVVVAPRDHPWWQYAGGAVQFLADLADGTLAPWGLIDVHDDGVTALAP
ncbi:SMI1/KNR4 family protein [Streptomyces sp. MS06]|uniref:SMI1/KNR4 family protein n=1 Tax=Streptomyces sp. MS06 TaxID=3385974 RepID=UPI0039A3CF97